jgi:radical SAM superfamily enzyme YgiQ (UPF0313 family)
MEKNTHYTIPKIAFLTIGLTNMAASKSTPPLGAMYLAAFLRKNLGADCRIIEAHLNRLTESQVGDVIADYMPHMIGITVCTAVAVEMHKFAAYLKNRFPDIPIVVGGPHASADMEDVLSDSNIDWLVYYEGEYTLLELVEAIWNGKSTENILGTAYCRNGKNIVNPPRPYIEDLDSLPFPAWDLIDYKAYFKKQRFSIIYKKHEYMPIFTSRACPFHCIYCHNIFGKKFRARSPDNVMAEIHELYHNYGIREFEIHDDCFNLNKARCKEILNRFAESDMQDAYLQFPNGLRSDLLDEEIILLMKKARVFRLGLAVETASPRLQKMIRKNLNLEKVKWVAKELYRKGIILHGYFMLGFPTETRNELYETVRFALDMEIHTASFFVVNPFKGTELLKVSQEMGIDIDTAPENYNYFKTRFNLSQVSDDELTSLVRKANFRFYISLKRIHKLIRVLYFNPKSLFLLFKIFLERTFSNKIG